MTMIIQENGPNAGRSYSIATEKTVVGRHPDCDVVVDVGAVSRRHAQFLQMDGKCFVEDLASRNGTFVNGQLINGRHLLKAGDRIQVCDITFRFDENQDDSQMSAVLIEDFPADSSRITSQVDLLSGKSGSIAITATTEAKLTALIEITQSLSRTLAVEEVMPRLLDQLFKIFIQADRGFIILKKDGKLVPTHTKLRRGDDDSMIRLSKTIINQVVETKQAVLSTDTLDDQRFQLSESIANFRIRSFICAPLPDAEGNVLGVIQLDSLDARNKFRDDDLDLLASVAGQLGIAIDNAQLHDRVVRQRVLERDLEVAAKVQQGFLPSRVPSSDRYELSQYYEPADKVGGDYFDFITLPDDRIAVVLADVVGHGIAAALQTAQLSTALQFSLANNRDPGMAMQELNQKLCVDSLDGRFITLCMVVLSLNEAKASIVNAGHLPPILCRRGERPAQISEQVQLPLLVNENYSYSVIDFELKNHDMLLLYTDGLTESENLSGDQYGIERVIDQAIGVNNGQELTKKLVADAKNFAGSAPQLDDICLVCCDHHE